MIAPIVDRTLVVALASLVGCAGCLGIVQEPPAAPVHVEAPCGFPARDGSSDIYAVAEIPAGIARERLERATARICLDNECTTARPAVVVDATHLEENCGWSPSMWGRMDTWRSTVRFEVLP